MHWYISQMLVSANVSLVLLISSGLSIDICCVNAKKLRSRPELLKIFHFYKSRNAYFQIDSSLNPSEPVHLDKNIDKDKENTNLEKRHKTIWIKKELHIRLIPHKIC